MPLKQKMEDLNKIKRRYGIMGRSPELDFALKVAMRVAPTDLSVLITGESGVGKEVFSQIIHQLSPRKHNNFIAINCGAIPPGTINSELFGHEKGSFTGATGERKGYFETVNGGTIFLDEIGEMPMDTQAYLLRVLESGEFLRVGSSKIQKTDVRVIAATNVKLEGYIKKNKFREDLFYRLNTVPIKIPPLRDRKDDIYLLFRKFCIDFAEKYHIEPIQLTPEAKKIIENYWYPGNIRELKNISEQLSILSESNLVSTVEIEKHTPSLLSAHFPAKTHYTSEEDVQKEKELFYQLLLDMRQEVNELKSFVLELIKINDLKIPSDFPKQLVAPQGPLPYDDYDKAEDVPPSRRVFARDFGKEELGNPSLIFQQKEEDSIKFYEDSEIIEEELSLEQMEKNMITRALLKYNGKRKMAAEELGISERTLYRKIKQYNLPS
jgi:transcriptional regulator with PAS, ATPase and Fis domain